MMKAGYKSSGKLVQVGHQSATWLEEHRTLDSLVANSTLEEEMPKLHRDKEEFEHSSLLAQTHVRTRA